MKSLYSILAFVASTVWLHAQITVTNATFPMAGDTLKYATDLSPEGVTITPQGGPAIWDFSTIVPNVRTEVLFKSASEGDPMADFPTADLVATSGGAQGETYYDVSASEFANLGFFGADPTGGGNLPIQSSFKFQPPVVERKAPLNFIDNELANTTLNVALPIDSILGAVLSQLGVPAGLADSLRIRLTATRTQLVDAYGSLTIPGGTYDVLRQKSTEYRDTHLDIHTLFGWIDVTGQAGGGAAGLGQDTVIVYNFISNTEKEYIAVVSMDNAGTTVQQVRYKDNGIASADHEVVGEQPQVLISPNPASETAVFELKNFAHGDYSLRLLDLSGKEVLMKKLGTSPVAVSLQGLGQGTYFYQILNEQHQAKATGKLLKIND